MEFYILPTQNPASNVRRILSQQVRHAINSLTDPEIDRDEGVHRARKSIKRIRAVLRMVRGGINDKTYQRENRFYRDVARDLSGARDSAVVLKTFNALARTHKEVPRKPLTAIRKHMKSFRDVEVDFPVADVVERLEAADMRIETLRFREKGFAVFSGGVGTVYADGREQLAACMKAPTVANFHEWRKNVKYLWHHMEILTPTWEGLTATYAESLHTLADYLGDDHDLAVLKDTLVELPDDVGDPDAVYQLITIIDVEREQLQENAIRLGKRIYAEDPVQFVRRTRSYYKLWRQEQRQQV